MAIAQIISRARLVAGAHLRWRNVEQLAIERAKNLSIKSGNIRIELSECGQRFAIRLEFGRLPAHR